MWNDAVLWPSAYSNLHVHLSPPCTTLSAANRDASSQAVAEGLESIRHALQFVLDAGYKSWSLENVSTPAVRRLLSKFVNELPERVAYTIVDAADLGTPSTRLRLIAGPPALIRRLREMPVYRVSVADAFESAGVDLPAGHIKNGTRTRNGKSCIRNVQGVSHTQLASHPLVWCKADGTTIRCLTVTETAILLGFPKEWMLPNGSRAGIRAIGNAVAPPVAKAIMQAACEARIERVPQ